MPGAAWGSYAAVAGAHATYAQWSAAAATYAVAGFVPVCAMSGARGASPSASGGPCAGSAIGAAPSTAAPTMGPA